MKCVVEKIKNLFWRRKTDSDESESRFHPLTPIDNSEDHKIYQDALEFSLQQDAVKNIAVTGPYGSGKSSVIQSFFKNSPNKYKVITLSLASFRDCEEESGQAEQQEQSQRVKKQTDKGQANPENRNNGFAVDSKLQRVIEISLLQQLFYHEKDNKLPDSQFKKIKKQSRCKLLIVTALGLIFILSLLYLLFPDFLKSLIAYDTTHWGQNWCWAPYVAPICLLGVSFFVLYKLSRVFISISVKKLNLKTAEIEIDQKIDKSILNSHIDEIIYFFEATDYDVVVIEDLDRFEQSEIFVKLREINRLINNCDKIKRKITFIYALKDEVFADKDRTKFFDFILPIVPIINYSNSGEKLRACLQTEIAKGHISEDCIDNISLFVNDMRLLYNIVNEYYIYSDKVNTSNSLDHNRLLSIIAYKNLYPKDFSDLAENKGVLFNAINKKGDLLMSQISSYNQKIEKLKERISEANKQSLKDVKELRLLYLSKIIEELNGNFKSFVYDNADVSMSKCAENDDIFQHVIDNRILYKNYQYNYNRSFNTLPVDFKTIEKEVDPNASYEQRSQAIQDKNSIATLETQIRELEDERDSLYKKTLSELWPEHKSDTKVQSNREVIIDIFIRSGYINENYNDYISIFHEGSLSRSDNQFIINVKRSVQSDMDYSLNHVENVFRKISFYSFEYPCTLNVSLANHLFEKYPDSKQAECFIMQLANESQPSLEFLKKYIFVCTSPQTLFSKLCASWKNIWRFVSLHETKEDIIEQYYHSILKYTELQDAGIVFDQNEAIIANDPSFLKKNIDHTRILEIVKRLNIKFSSLNPNFSDEDFEFVRKNRHYVLTPENLKVLIRKEHWDADAFIHKNYSYLNQLEDKSILEYVNENLADYIRKVWLKLDSKREEEEYLIQLINSKNIDLTLKEQVVEKVEVLIDNIEDIEDSNDWEIVFLYMKVRPSWENVRAYSIAKGGITGAVLSCVENVSFVNQLVENKFPQEEGYKNLALQIISLKEISTNLYTKLVRTIPWKITEVPTDLPRENVQILIENDIVKEVIAAYESLKEHYKGLHIQLMLHYFEEFETRFEDLHFSSEDLRSILSVKSISDNQLQKIIDSFDNDTIVEDMTAYNQILEKCIKGKITINDELITEAMMNPNVLQDIRIRLFNKYYKLISTSIADFIENLDQPYSSLNDKDTRFSYIPKSELNKSFLSLLRILNVIGTFSEKQDKYKVNHKRK